MLDCLTVLIHVAQCSGDVIVGFGQQATVWRQVIQLQGETLLEVFQSLGIVSCRGEQSEVFGHSSHHSIFIS